MLLPAQQETPEDSNLAHRGRRLLLAAASQVHHLIRIVYKQAPTTSHGGCQVKACTAIGQERCSTAACAQAPSGAYLTLERLRLPPGA